MIKNAMRACAGRSVWAAVAVAGLLSGCQSTPDMLAVEHKEVTREYDVVFGSSYRPNFRAAGHFTPVHVLVLPATGAAERQYIDLFEREFVGQLRAKAPFLVTSWADATRGALRPSPSDRPTVYATAKALGCDYILSVAIPAATPFQPISMLTDLRMESVATGGVTCFASGHYDTTNQLVCNAARKFYKSTMPPSNAPDKSLHILQNADMFTRYVASDSAWSLARELAPQPQPHSAPARTPSAQGTTGDGVGTGITPEPTGISSRKMY